MADLEDIDDEIVLPGVVGEEENEEKKGVRGSLGFVPKSFSSGAVDGKKAERVEAVTADDDELEDVVETAYERLIGLSEILPDPFWDVLKRSGVFSWWLVRRSAWVAGSSLVVILLPIFIQQQRLEVEEMQSMQKKQMLLGPSAATPMRMP